MLNAVFYKEISEGCQVAWFKNFASGIVRKSKAATPTPAVSNPMAALLGGTLTNDFVGLLVKEKLPLQVYLVEIRSATCNESKVQVWSGRTVFL